MVNDFETSSDLDRIRWTCHTLYTLSDDHVTHGIRSLKMTLYPYKYPGVSLIGFDKDWAPYGRLRLDIENALKDKPVAVILRIDDTLSPEYENRINRMITLNPGVNAVDIPFAGLVTPSGRHLNMANIKNVMIFMEHPESPTVLYLDHIRLVR
jgi:hypothetical protein